MLSFTQPDLLSTLTHSSEQAIDEASFGIVKMDQGFQVLAYNPFEQQLSGLDRSQVLGRHFFREVAPCTNTTLVAGRYQAGTDLDEVVPYLFTYRMLPTSVRLRLLGQADASFFYLAVEKVDD
jgi:photoactive yellow protein